jgi:hypothetical protein
MPKNFSQKHGDRLFGRNRRSVLNNIFTNTVSDGYLGLILDLIPSDDVPVTESEAFL